MARVWIAANFSGDRLVTRRASFAQPLSLGERRQWIIQCQKAAPPVESSHGPSAGYPTSGPAGEQLVGGHRGEHSPSS